MEKEIQANFEELLSNDENLEVDVSVEGNRANIKVVSEAFVGMSRVARQQLIYSCINDLIQGGHLHAVSIVTHTSAEV